MSVAGGCGPVHSGHSTQFDPSLFPDRLTPYRHHRWARLLWPRAARPKPSVQRHGACAGVFDRRANPVISRGSSAGMTTSPVRDRMAIALTPGAEAAALAQIRRLGSVRDVHGSNSSRTRATCQRDDEAVYPPAAHHRTNGDVIGRQPDTGVHMRGRSWIRRPAPQTDGQIRLASSASTPNCRSAASGTSPASGLSETTVLQPRQTNRSHTTASACPSAAPARSCVPQLPRIRSP